MKDWSSVFDAYEGIDEIFVAGNMPFIHEVPAENYAREKGLVVEKVKRVDKAAEAKKAEAAAKKKAAAEAKKAEAAAKKKAAAEAAANTESK